jgi:hypothetical protein
MSVVILSNGYFPDPDKGSPIASGYIYVGNVDTDPTIAANQKTMSVLQEDGSEVVVSQPLRTSAGGVPTYSGSPVTIIAASPYSLLVQDSSQVQKIYSPSNTGSSQANEDWSEEGAAVAFDSASTFTVAGDVTTTYTAHRAIKLTQTANDTGFVTSSVYAGGPDETTVTVRAATVDSGLSKVEYGQEVASSPGGSDEDFYANTVGNVTTDSISEETTDNGVDIDGVLCKDSEVTADLKGNADTATKIVFRGCSVYLTTSQSIPHNTLTAIDFASGVSSEDYDTSSIHDPTANSTRLTVPTGVTRIKLFANIPYASNSTGNRQVQIWKNGAAGDIYFVDNIDAMATSGTNVFISTPTVTVAGGDYFELYAFQTSGGALDADGVGAGNRTYFAMEIIG